MSEELVEAEAKDQKDQIVITIHETAENTLSLRSVDLFVPDMKIRLSSQNTDEIDQVFYRDVAALVKRICESATLPKQIINVPDFCLRFRGLAIRGYTLLVHTMENGLRQFIVRLKRGVGNVLALFRDVAPDNSGLNLFGSDRSRLGGSSATSARLFDEMLSNLYLPLVNLNSYLRTALDSPVPISDHALSGSIVQLKTKAEVLQFAFDRLISERMLDTYAQGDSPLPRKTVLPYAEATEIRQRTA